MRPIHKNECFPVCVRLWRTIHLALLCFPFPSKTTRHDCNHANRDFCVQLSRSEKERTIRSIHRIRDLKFDIEKKIHLKKLIYSSFKRNQRGRIRILNFMAQCISTEKKCICLCFIFLSEMNSEIIFNKTIKHYYYSVEGKQTRTFKFKFSRNVCYMIFLLLDQNNKIALQTLGNWKAFFFFFINFERTYHQLGIE